MRIEKTVNTQYRVMKADIENEFIRNSVKEDKIAGTGYLQPTVSPLLTEYILENTSKVNVCCDVLSEDVCLQEYLFKPFVEEIDTSLLERFWNKYNKYQLKLASYEYYSYGYGCLEVVMDNKGIPQRLEQFPSKTARIKKNKNSKGEDIFYAVQLTTAVQSQEIRFRLFDYLDKYDKEDNDLPVCLWIGGDNRNQFYSTPSWFSEHSKLLGKINLDLLNADNFNEGNQIGGILTFIGSPQRPNEEGLTPQQILQKQIRDAGTGNLVVYMESMDAEIPLSVDYIKISNDNWDYLQEYSKTVDNDTLACYRVPKTRLMDNAETESMNSHKSDSIWEIYTISLNYRQLPFEMLIRQFNKIMFNIDAEVEMNTPIFTDKKDTDLQNTVELFKNGLLTLGQAISRLESLLVDVDFSMIDYDAPFMNDRFKDGKLFGLETNEPSELDATLNKLLGL